MAATRPRPRARTAWRTLVPVVCLVAGFGFATSARDSGGTDLRPPGTADLRDLVRSAEDRVRAGDEQLAQLQKQLSAATQQAGRADSQVAADQAKVAPLRGPAGETEVHGPGLLVVLDDAKESTQTQGVDPNQLVVHQSDLQAVVNALWAGGAEAMSIAGSRVIPTSAVRCVGNTLLLNGEVFSPPYRVVAIGPARAMTAALNASSGVRTFEQAAGYWGLGYTVATMTDVTVPAYQGTMGLQYATVPSR